MLLSCRWACVRGNIVEEAGKIKGERRLLADPVEQGPGYGVGLFQGRGVTAIGHDDQPGAGNGVGHFAGAVRRRQRVSVADQDQGRHRNGGKTGTAVGAGDDGRLLAREAFDAHRQAHAHGYGVDARIVLVVGVQQQRHDDVEQGLKIARARLGDQGVALGGVLRRVGTGRSVEQGQLDDAFGRLAQDLEAEIAAHRNAAQDKARRGVGQDGGGDFRHAGAVQRRGYGDRATGPQGFSLGGEAFGRAQQAGDEQDRGLGHGHGVSLARASHRIVAAAQAITTPLPG